MHVRSCADAFPHAPAKGVGCTRLGGAAFFASSLPPLPPSFFASSFPPLSLSLSLGMAARGAQPRAQLPAPPPRARCQRVAGCARAHLVRAARTMVQWAPLHVPLARRVQTAAVVAFLSVGPVLLAATLALALASRVALALLLAYAAWVFLVDRATPRRGGRPCRCLQRARLWAHVADYFPLTVHTPHAGEYAGSGGQGQGQGPLVFGLHPHGILGVSHWLTFAADPRGVRGALGLDVRLLTVAANFRIPLWRDYLMGLGFVDASPESMAALLAAGTSVAVVVGGAREALDARPHTLTLTLRRRQGFVRLALAHGARALVPVLAFGENELFEQAPNPPGSRLRRCQEAMLRWVRVTAPVALGRGVCQYSCGLLPRRRPLHVVLGPPVPLQPAPLPTEAAVAAAHAAYEAALRALHAQWAPRLGAKAALDIVD
jgi:hypothetical protein